MKRVIFCVLTIFLLQLLTSCSDKDDWIPYKNETYNVYYKIEGNIFLISDIESELSTLVEEYADDVKLTFVQYQFNNETTGTAEFQFFKEYNTKGKYYSVIITLLADINDGVIYKLNYEEGISKRVRGYRNSISRNNENAYNVYISNLYNVKLDKKELEYSNVIFLNENIIVCHYDKYNNLILRTEFWKLHDRRSCRNTYSLRWARI